MPVKCLLPHRSTTGNVLFVLVVVLIVLVVQRYTPGDVHQLLVDITGLVALAAGAQQPVMRPVSRQIA